MADSSRNSTKTEAKTSGGDIETVVPPPKEVKLLQSVGCAPPNLCDNEQEENGFKGEQDGNSSSLDEIYQQTNQ